jgi:hypothetical protein
MPRDADAAGAVDVRQVSAEDRRQVPASIAGSATPRCDQMDGPTPVSETLQRDPRGDLTQDSIVLG